MKWEIGRSQHEDSAELQLYNFTAEPPWRNTHGNACRPADQGYPPSCGDLLIFLWGSGRVTQQRLKRGTETSTRTSAVITDLRRQFSLTRTFIIFQLIAFIKYINSIKESWKGKEWKFGHVGRKEELTYTVLVPFQHYRFIFFLLFLHFSFPYVHVI